MVKIEEVRDESEKPKQQGLNAEFDDDNDWEEDEEDSDDDSDADDLVTERGLVVPNETLWQRIAALKDIISPKTRASLSKSFQTFSAYGYFGGWVAGKLVWIGVTSALIVGLPFALAVEDESRISAQEKEMLAQQGGAPQGLAPTTGTAPDTLAQPTAQPGQTQGLRPPGF